VGWRNPWPFAVKISFDVLQKRSQLVKKLNDSDHQSSTSPLMEGTPTIKSKKKLLQIIDTTLLKCYLHVSFCLTWRPFIYHASSVGISG